MEAPPKSHGERDILGLGIVRVCRDSWVAGAQLRLSVTAATATRSPACVALVAGAHHMAGGRHRPPRRRPPFVLSRPALGPRRQGRVRAVKVRKPRRVAWVVEAYCPRASSVWLGLR